MLLKRLVRRFSRARFERDMTEELRDHLSRRADDLIRAGHTPDEAQRRARIEFGALEGYKEQLRDGRAGASIGAAAEHAWRDVTFALRRLRAAPLFTAFSVATLAIGIGVTTAMYSVIDGATLNAVGVRDPGEIVSVRQVVQHAYDFSGPEIAELRARQTPLGEFAVVASFSSAMSIGGRAELISGEAVSGTVFQMLGIVPARGRLIRPADDRADAPDVLVISDNTWRRLFNADPNVVGTLVRMAGRSFEIIGVAPATFRGTTRRRGTAALWVPMAVAPGWGSARIDLLSPGNREFAVFGRLPLGVSIAHATAQLTPIVQQLDAIAPIAGTIVASARRPLVTSAFDTSRSGGVLSDSVIIVLALPALLLLVASSNLANLSISRGASRRHEFAVRRALGGTRWQLVREQLTEGAIVATVGGAAGCALAGQLLRSGTELVRDTFGAQAMLNTIEPEMSPAVFIAAGGFAVLAFLTASLAPALQLTRPTERAILATDAGAGAAPKWRSRANLIALQICVSVCLFLLTALGVRVMLTESRKAPFAELDHVAQVDLPFGMQQRDEPVVRDLVNRILERVRQHPGIDDVAARSWQGGVSLATPERPFASEADKGIGATLTVMTPGADRLTGTTIRFGRAIDGQDAAGQAPVVVISESLAKQLFSVPNTTGRDVLVRMPDMTVRKMVTRAFQVVGISEDTPGPGDSDITFVPFSQQFFPDVSILARGSRLDIDAIATVLRTAVHDVDADLAIAFAGRAILDQSSRNQWTVGAMLRLWTGAAALLATLALVLSMAGLYGVLSHVVSRRTRELGLRMALGADRGRIVRLILQDGFRPIVEGLVIGLIAALILRMMLQPVFTNPIAAFDPIAFALAAGPLLLAGALACYLPARRAARVEPNVALRDL